MTSDLKKQITIIQDDLCQLISEPLVLGLWKGLEIAWDLRLRHVEMESDSQLGISLVTNADITQASFNLIYKI
ncbi:hypothetical protein ACH5RR_021469 [Cinchona calisaya]|uniref:RNase H type-1 domain-containing protein n=1 Tax=Cinchona calisaya TaxID=153742 RepID=A0ABD2ZKY5_9GENT